MHKFELGHKKRVETIFLLYRYCILNYDVKKIEQDILDDKQIVVNDEQWEKYLLDLAKNIVNIKDQITPFIKKDWTWSRLANFVKAALIEGVFEIQNTQTNKAIIINDIVEIVKENQPDVDYRFVNALLDKFSQ